MPRCHMNWRYAVIVAFCFAPRVGAQVLPRLTLQEAISTAQTQDPWLLGSQSKQAALMAQSVVQSSLPDPTLSLSMLNLPADNFTLNQEPMTQLKLGISQMIPRGNTLALKKAQLRTLSQQ